MATFAQYVAPQVSTVDWSAITDKLSTGLQKVYDEREAEKASLDKMAIDAVNKVNEAELGKSKTANEFFLAGIDNYRDAIYSQNKLLKQGKLSPSQYRMNLLRGQEGWNNFAKDMQTFNADYADFIEKYNNNEVDEFDVFVREKYFSLMNIKDKDIYTNPIDLNIYIADRDSETGEIKQLLNPKTINNTLNQDYVKVDLVASAKEYADKLGKFGGIDPVTNKYVLSGVDERKRAEYLKQGADSILVNDRAIASVLLSSMKDSNGQPMYKPYSKAEYDKLTPEEKGKAVIIEPNAEGVFTAQLTDEQRKSAENYTMDVISSMIEFKEKDPFEEWYKRQSLYASLNKDSGSGKVTYNFKPDIEAIYADPLSNISYFKGANTKFGTIDNVTVVNTPSGKGVNLRFYKGQDSFGVPIYVNQEFQGNALKAMIYDVLVSRIKGGGRVIPFSELYPPSAMGGVIGQEGSGTYSPTFEDVTQNPIFQQYQAQKGKSVGSVPSEGSGLEFDNY